MFRKTKFIDIYILSAEFNKTERRAIAMDFIPYKSNETLEHKYYQIPQELFVNEKYKNKLNSDSKILYAFLLDRLSLS